MRGGMRETEGRGYRTHILCSCIHMSLWSSTHTLYSCMHICEGVSTLCLLKNICFQVEHWWHTPWNTALWRQARYLSSRQAGSIAWVATQSAKGIHRNPVSKCSSAKDTDTFSYSESCPVLPMNLWQEVHFALLCVVIPYMLVLDTWLYHFCQLSSNLLSPSFFC